MTELAGKLEQLVDTRTAGIAARAFDNAPKWSPCDGTKEFHLTEKGIEP